MSQKYAFLEKIGREPSNLIKGLQAVQGVEGYVSDESIRAISEYFGIPEVEVEGVLSFYAQFKRVKPGKYKIAICDGTACHVRKSIPILDRLRSELALSDKKVTTDDLGFTVETVSCLGACGLAPVLTVNDKVYPAMTPDKASELVAVLKEEL